MTTTQQNERCWLVQRGKTDDTEHSKYWMYEIQPQANGGFVLHTNWGRIGTDGQKKDFTYGYKGDVDRHAYSKKSEKLGKGYHEVKEEEIELLKAQAKIIGTRMKPLALEFVVPETSKGSSAWKIVSKSEIADPSLKVSVWCAVQSPEGIRYDVVISENDCVLGKFNSLVKERSGGYGSPEKIKSFILTNEKRLAECQDKTAQKLLERIPPIVGTLF